MGEFVTVTAFRTDAAAEVLQAVGQFFSSHGWPASRVGDGGPMREGVFLDRFATMPDYFTDDPEQIARLKAKFAGQPSLVAETIGKPVEQIAAYLVHLEIEDDDDEDEMGKAFPDDEFDLDSAWVFVDFWRRLGIRYPAEDAPYEARLRLAPGWSGKLPVGDAEL